MTEDAVTFVTTDADSDASSGDEYTSSSSEEVTYVKELVVENPQPRKCCRARRERTPSISSARWWKVNHSMVGSKEEHYDNASLDSIWVREDKAPVVPEFTGNPVVMIDLPPDPSGLEIFKHFVTDELIEMIAEQINVYTNQNIWDHLE